MNPNNTTPQLHNASEQSSEEQQQHPYKKIVIIIGALSLCILFGIFAYTVLAKEKDELKESIHSERQSTSQASTVAEQLMATYSNDIITTQQVECAPRVDDEWYRTDHTLAIDPKNPQTMFVSIEWKGVYKSTDGGVTWQKKTKGILAYARKDDPSKNCHGEYPTIKIDPRNSEHIVLITSGGGGGYLSLSTPNSQTGGIYQSFDGGEIWKLTTGDTMNIYATNASFSPDGNSLYYTTASNPASWKEADQNKLYVKDGLILKSSDDGNSWNELKTGTGNRSSVTNIFINKDDPQIMIAPTFSAQRSSADGTGTGISDGKIVTDSQLGILKSADGGTTWTSLEGSKNYPYVFSAVSPTAFNNQFYVPYLGNGGEPFAYTTIDGGNTLKKTKHLDTVVYDPHDTSGKHMLGFTSMVIGPNNQNLTLWQSTDGGVNWQRYGNLPADISNPNDRKTRISSIVWHPTDTQTIFMSGAGGHVWKSSDRGLTWTTLLSIDSLSE